MGWSSRGIDHIFTENSLLATSVWLVNGQEVHFLPKIRFLFDGRTQWTDGRVREFQLLCGVDACWTQGPFDSWCCVLQIRHLGAE